MKDLRECVEGLHTPLCICAGSLFVLTVAVGSWCWLNMDSSVVVEVTCECLRDMNKGGVADYVLR